VLAVDEGLLLTNDSGRTWQRLPGWQGVARHVDFSPISVDAFLVASDAKGVWATSDCGKTFRQVGSKQAGMAADEATGVYHYPPNARFLAMMVVHGDAAPGLSLSEDGGKSWRVLAGQYHVYQALCGATGDLRLFLAASKSDRPEVRSIYTCHSVGEPWYEAVRDVVPTALAASVLRGPVFLSTADAGMYRLTHEGANYQEVGPEDVSCWASVGITWDSHADAQLLYAYDPDELGMLVSTDGMKTFSSQSRGLFTGPFVREGAHIRANANGTVFYAVANGVLYRGLRLGGLRVADAQTTPAALSFASKAYRAAQQGIRDALVAIARSRSVVEPAEIVATHLAAADAALPARDLEITAKVVGREEPKQVTVDLSRIGGSPCTPMAGTEQPGVYQCRLALEPRSFERRRPDWRRSWPGRLGFTVTAVSPEAKLSAAVAPFFLRDRPESFLWQSDFRYRKPREPKGVVAFEGSQDTVASRRRWTALELTVGPGDWEVAIGEMYSTTDVTGFQALGFWIKTKGDEADDFLVQLRDNPDYAAATTSKPVTLVKEGLVPGGTIPTEYHRILIPMQRLLRDAPGLQTRLLGFVVLSGTASRETTYWIDELRFFLNKRDLEEDERRLADE